jgi:nucleoside-diphosphate-sugar epimerase
MPVISGDAGHLPFVHIDDAVSATVLALERGAPGNTFDIVDDRAVSFSEFVGAVARCTDSPTPWSLPAWVARLLAPDMARMLAVRLPLANAPARTELGWRPHYPTVYDALTGMRRNAA